MADSPQPPVQTKQPLPPGPTDVKPADKPAEPVAGQPPAPAPKKNRKRLILGAVLLVIILGFLAWYLLAKNKTINPAESGKKDIPLFTVEYIDSEVPQYPVTSLGYGSDISITQQMFEGLVQYQDQTKIKPLLATSWSNPDPSTWIFDLQHNIKFHTGRDMTASDVKYTIDYIINHSDDEDGVAANVTSLDTIKSTEVVNPYQIKITTNQPDPLLLAKLTFVGIVDSKAKAGAYDAGTGPYVLKTGTKPSSTDIDLAAAPDYWGGHVYTKELKFHIETSHDQLVKDVSSNKYDLIGSLTAATLKNYKVSYSKVLISTPGTDFLMLNVNRKDSPLNSLAARQAMDYAINRGTFLARAGIEGTTANQVVPISLPGHNPNIPDTPYDLDKAKQLLAGVKNVNTQLTFGGVGGNSETNTIMDDLTAAGFNLKLIDTRGSSSFDSDVAAGKYDIVVWGYSSSFVDGLDILKFDLSGTSNYDNPKIDDLLDQTAATFDSGKRIKLMQEIATIAYQDKPVIPLLQGNDVYALTKPYVVKVDQPDFASSIYFWKAYEK